jgi:hypothetical protein
MSKNILSEFDKETQRLFGSAEHVARLYGQEIVHPEFVMAALTEERNDDSVCGLLFDTVTAEQPNFRAEYFLALTEIYEESVFADILHGFLDDASTPEEGVINIDGRLKEILAEAKVDCADHRSSQNSKLPIPVDYFLRALFAYSGRLDILDMALKRYSWKEEGYDDDDWGCCEAGLFGREDLAASLLAVSRILDNDCPLVGRIVKKTGTRSKAKANGGTKTTKKTQAKKTGDEKGPPPHKIERHLRRTIIGQDEAIEVLMRAIKLNEAGLKEPQKPIGVFLFAGYTGVGKTELARQLALGGGLFFKRFDMSEYKESHEYAKLIGAPPGYVGYEEGGQLTDAIRMMPRSVIVFDEVEKAHPDIMNLLLQIAEEGTLTDGAGHVRDFNKAIVILTSNIGAHEATQRVAGFATADQTQRERQSFNSAVKKYFKPELLGRITTVVFNPLKDEAVMRITQLELKKLAKRFKGKLKITSATKRRIALDSNVALYGARDIKRTIDQKIALPLAEYLLEHKCSRSDAITISYERKTDSYVFSH